MTEMRPKTGAAPGIDAQMRADAIAASIAVMVREMRDSGVSQDAAFRCLAAAPDKIDAALTRGAGALVLYRLDANAPRGIVSDRDDKLEAFVRAARDDRAPVCGLNPWRIARLVDAMRADGARAVSAVREKFDA